VGAWSLILVCGLLLAFVGLFTHWSLILLGAALPVLPLLLEVLRRRRRP
jgi:hypothetical protein